jgi:3-oxoacyl-[acyl-carrier-protein] synthase-3
MNAALTELFLIAFGLVGLLPLLFFRRGGRFNARWWLTAAPFFGCAVLLVLAYAGVIDPWVDPASAVGEVLAVLATPLAAASIGLVGLTVGSHEQRVALWHQPDQLPDALVTRKAYRRLRHPFYLAFMLGVRRHQPVPAASAGLGGGRVRLHRPAPDRAQRRAAPAGLAARRRVPRVHGAHQPLSAARRAHPVTTAVYLSDIGVALGEREHVLEESAAAGRLSSRPEALRAAGFDRHWIAAPGTGAVDLAAAALEPLRPALHDIDVLIHSSALPCNACAADGAAEYAATRDVRHQMDFAASRLQVQFGLDEAALVGIGQQACTGLLGSIRLGAAMLGHEPDLRRVLCVTADRFPEGALYEQAFNLVSDGASACLLSREPRGFRVLAAHQVSNGALVLANAEQTAGAFFPYMHRLVTQALAKAGMQPPQLDWLVTQNTDDKAWQVLASLLGMEVARFYSPTRAALGHVISSDCLANLAALEADPRLQPGHRVLLTMAGYGSHWQAVLLERT